ncbi:MAG: tetratricopeptide repeat protein, partial [Gemmatimonadota bacterium]|nr:tetratricopeptide repeat protein [Gemmatimonadota bacterium]
PAPATTQRLEAPLKSESEIRELDIQYFSERAKRDPTGAMDLGHLSALYLARGRETGDPRDAILAEQAARQSLHNRKERNGGATQVLETSLLAQHRFDEALPLAVAARDADPENPALRAALGDIQMEMGLYDSARVSFANLHVALGDPSVAPRLARWAEIEGQPEKARRLLHAALMTVQKLPEVPREQLAWYWLRIGDVELRSGHPVAADSAYQTGLAIHPDDYRLLSALCHSALLQQQWQKSITFGERAIAVTLDPATLGTLSDAYAATGDTAKSAEYAHVLDVAVLKQPGSYHRAWSLFLLDHGQHLQQVSRKIREEVRTRKDIYAYDLLAWSLHKAGRDVDARSAMSLALREGTRDAQLFYHAGMIEHSLGHDDAARAQLALALAVNPFFHPTQVADARATLALLTHPQHVADATASSVR